jgi:hypothetical protein
MKSIVNQKRTLYKKYLEGSSAPIALEKYGQSNYLKKTGFC